MHPECIRNQIYKLLPLTFITETIKTAPACQHCISHDLLAQWAVEFYWQVITNTARHGWGKFCWDAISRAQRHHRNKRTSWSFGAIIPINILGTMMKKMPRDPAFVTDIARWRCLPFYWAMLNEMPRNMADTTDIARRRCLAFHWAMLNEMPRNMADATDIARWRCLPFQQRTAFSYR